MFTINKNYGIGEVIEMTDTMVKVYFPDEDLEKSLMRSFTTLYNTREEAELALNPEMTVEEVSLRMADMAKENKIRVEGAKSQQWLEETNHAMAVRQMKNI